MSDEGDVAQLDAVRLVDAKQRATSLRLVNALAELALARHEFQVSPNDITRRRVVEAEIGLEDALAVVQEWCLL